MKLKVLFLLICFISTAAATGFDESIIWHRFISRPDSGSEGFIYGKNEFKSVYLYSNIYGLDALSWNYLSLAFDKKRGGAGLEFSSIGYSRYYRRNRYTAYVKYNPGKNIRVAPALEIITERFGDIGSYAAVNGEIFMGYMTRKYYFGSGISGIELNKAYDGGSDDRIEPYIFGSRVFGDGLTFTIGIRRFRNDRTRWLFDQYIAVNKNLALNFGYKNKPSNIYGGIELTINRISVIINYSSVGELSDTIIWGISFRK